MVSRNVKLIFRKMQEDTVEVEWRTKLVFTRYFSRNRSEKYIAFTFVQK